MSLSCLVFGHRWVSLFNMSGAICRRHLCDKRKEYWYAGDEVLKMRPVDRRIKSLPKFQRCFGHSQFFGDRYA